MKSKAKVSEAQIAGLSEHTLAQKEEYRRRLVEAADRTFTRAGYLRPSVEDIAKEAGVSRQTFYKHFDGKPAIALEYFHRQDSSSFELWTAIAHKDFHDRVVVMEWIDELFDHFEGRRNSLRTFSELTSVEPRLLGLVDESVRKTIACLGETIPGFAYRRDGDLQAQRRWYEAWQFLWILREQCSRNATGRLVVPRRVVVESLAQAFLGISRIGKD